MKKSILLFCAVIAIALLGCQVPTTPGYEHIKGSAKTVSMNWTQYTVGAVRDIAAERDVYAISADGKNIYRKWYGHNNFSTMTYKVGITAPFPNDPAVKIDIGTNPRTTSMSFFVGPWVVAESGKLYRLHNDSFNWDTWTEYSQAPLAKDIGADWSDAVALLSADGRTIHSYASGSWSVTYTIPAAYGTGEAIDVVAGTIWFTTSTGKVYRLVSGSAVEVPGILASDIGGTSSETETSPVFAVEKLSAPGTAKIYQVKADFTGWELVSGDAERITADRYGTPWIVNKQGEVFEGKASSEFIKAEGRLLKKGGETILLQGVCFSNYYYNPSIDLATSKHHQEIDFQRVSNMGMNVIRFGINGLFFESSPGVFKESAFDWLDTRLEWAERYGVYLIIDMHVPIGGDWLNANAAKDFSIWTNSSVRARNIALWEEIARRYKDNPWIAAYNVINEPVTSDSTGAQWKSFATDAVAAIRAIDQNHMLIIERLYGTNGGYDYDPSTEIQFLVNDDNVMYDFHFYDPDEYTHQYAHWVQNPKDGGKYPDPELLKIVDWNMVEWKGAINSDDAASGTANWTPFTGSLVTVTDSAVEVGVPNVIVEGTNGGTVYFDNLVVKEYDSNGNFIQDILVENITQDTITEWYDWTYGTGASIGTSARVTNLGNGDSYCLKLSSTAGTAGWSNGYKLVKITTGNKYQVCGDMKTVGVPSTASAHLNLTLYSDKDPNGKTIVARDKELLRSAMLQWMQFGIDNNVPMSVTEVGTINYTFENNKGGLNWVTDILDLFNEYSLNFTYWQYHADEMGLYFGDDSAFPSPTNSNTALIDLFTQKLGGSTPPPATHTPTPTATPYIPAPTPTATFTPVPPTPTQGTGIPAWSASAVYNGGDVVTHNGSTWKAQWWTQGEEPGTTGEWGVWRVQ